MGETLHIKNMVCNRCKMVVSNVLNAIGVEARVVELGEVQIQGALSSACREEARKALAMAGFELITDKRGRLIELTKTAIIRLVHHADGKLKGATSDYLAKEVGVDYTYLSHLFSDVEGTTIEKFVIAQRIERVKELLVYNELSLSEIAYELNYSSVAHLSNQFKRVTGLTPSHFKGVKESKRTPLDEV